MIIPVQQYKEILEVLPILCVDIVIKNQAGEYLLIKRANEPLKGKWWVIGGRVFKGESLELAAKRKIKEEVGLEVNNVKLLGYYEDMFEKNPFGESTLQHAVSVVFEALIDDYQPIILDDQSEDWQYFSELPSDFHIRSCIL